VLAALALAVARMQPVGAQVAARSYRIGVLGNATRAAVDLNPLWQAFLEGLRRRGYREGQNLAIEYALGEGHAERLPALVAALVASKVDCIVVPGPSGMQAARQATQTIPIVMIAGSADPVGEGLIASFARPGGNITGLTYAVSPERFGKQLELLREAAAGLRRFAVLWDAEAELYERTWAPHMEKVALELGLQHTGPILVRSADDYAAAFADMAARDIGGLVAASARLNFANRARISELALAHGIAVMASFAEFARSGSLMSFGPNFPDLYRRGAGYVDKVLQGTPAGEIPVEQPLKYHFAVNLRTAAALKLELSDLLLARADEVIE